MIKKNIAVFLCAVICAFSFSTSVFAENSETEIGNEYPFVFVHGLMGWGEAQGVDKMMPYWGTTGGSIPKYLEKQGYEVYTASVGGASSAWDRACELYAQLTGTTVDYGAAHSEKYGHSRFGRTYKEPLCPTFGKTDENGEIIKINLVGHSMGGVTVRLLASLLEYGAPEETAACSDTSELFKGGKGDYIFSISTLSAPHNGSVAADKENNAIIRMFVYCFYYLWGIIDNTPLRPFWDIQFEQFGLTDCPEDGFEGNFDTELINEMMNSQDSAYYDLTLKGAAEANERIKILDNVYYFSYSSECVFEDPITGKLYPEPTMNPLFFLTSPGICEFDKDEQMGIPTDKSWQINDGIVSTVSALYPDGEPHKDFDEKNIEKGVWNVMPVIESMDHTDYMGVFYNPIELRKFYSGVCELVCSLPK
ncbi:MAG: hypothetical protein SPI97_02660 [Oscillospiraceae bacterium]|nr:hypothetical protein [Oscillospiraceae bacterium]